MVVKSTISDLLLEEADLLLVCDSGGQDSLLQNMIVQSQGHIGIISDEFPFLSALSTIENIVLGNVYHQNISIKRARKRISEYVRILGLGNYLWKSVRHLPDEKLLLAMLLRCIASGNSIVFMGKPGSTRAEIVKNAVTAGELPVKPWVSCLDKDHTEYAALGLKKVLFRAQTGSLQERGRPGAPVRVFSE